MKPRSLLLRLGSAAAVLIALALSMAGFALVLIFKTEMERRALESLVRTSRVIAAQVRVAADGRVSLDVEPNDPRFDTPYGGRYWQADAAGQRARSRSLWDFELTISGHKPDGERWETDLPGPDGAQLFAVVQDLVVRSAAGRDVEVRIVSALDRREIEEAQRSFTWLLVPSLMALGALLIAAMAIFLRLALAPFRDLGRGLRAIHAGERRNLPGQFPDEVQPVVDDLNRLIAFQDSAVERARVHAGDLAHGLKTPLAILGAVARKTTDEGRSDLAALIEEQITAMNRQVERTLARARAGLAAAVGTRAAPVTPVIEKVAGAFRRMSDDRPLTWEKRIDAGLAFGGDPGDITEMLGNLLDNARKWAKGRIRITATAVAGVLQISIEDDGPGLTDEQSAAIARGQRWDESQPGTGFGLAITRDLAEAYGGTFTLGRSEWGGLSATINIPLARPTQNGRAQARPSSDQS